MLSPLFLAHGSPFIIFEETDFTRYLNRLGQSMSPKAIVVFSAHWETEEVTITFTDGVNETIYDYYGFPPEFYTVNYPAKGSTQAASDLQRRFAEHGIRSRTEDRGLDHGCWPILLHMYPKADIPVLQVSINPFLSPEAYFRIGEAVRGLEDEGILVIGSGFLVHNIPLFMRDRDAFSKPWANEFTDWIVDKVKARDIEALVRYMELAPHAKLAVPRPEHFVPLYIAMGSGKPDADIRVIYGNGESPGETPGYTSFRF